VDGGHDGDALALACAQAMLARDRAARTLGIVLAACRPGFARLTMMVDDGALNGHGIAHGGAVFTLADTAFACACNSRDVPHVALNATISFLAPVRLGERLEAVARECSLRGRTGVYDVTIATDSGAAVALFRGTCYRIHGTVLDGGNVQAQPSPGGAV
jgi:acyl-CoA thioesterase